MTSDSFETRLRLASFLVALGLLVEAIVWRIVHPLAFVAFLGIACPLVVAGMLVFLWALATAER